MFKKYSGLVQQNGVVWKRDVLVMTVIRSDIVERFRLETRRFSYHCIQVCVAERISLETRVLVINVFRSGIA